MANAPIIADEVRDRANRTPQLPTQQLASPMRPPAHPLQRNWRYRASLDGYTWSYNWSGTITITDTVPANATGQPFSTVIAISPEPIKEGDVLIVKNGFASCVDTGYTTGPVRLTALLQQLRLTETTRAQACRMSSPTPQFNGSLFNLLKQMSDFQPNDSEPVFFGTDFMGMASGTGAGAVAVATPQLPYIGAPILLEHNRVYANATAGALGATCQVSFDIDFYRRDSLMAGRRP